MLLNASDRRWVVLSLVVCAAIFSCTLTYPFNNDNALYAYMADLALKGHLPYVGSWDQNFPGIILVHALQILVSGRSQLAFHAFDIILQLIGSVFLILIGKRLFGIRAGVLAAILASLYYVQQGLWMAGERDTYVSIMLLAAFYFALDRKKPVLVGVLSSLAFLFRPTYGLYGVAFLFWFLLAPRASEGNEGEGYSALANGHTRTSSLDGRVELLPFLIGAAAPIALFVIWYWAIGGLEAFWDATILFNFKVYAGEGAEFSLWEPVRFYAISLIAVIAGAMYLWKHERQQLWLWIGLFASSVISLIILYRHSVYHYHPAMTFFLLLSAIGWIRIADLLAARWNPIRYAVLVLVLLYFLFSTFRGNTIQHVLADIASGRIHSLQESYDRYEASPDFGVRVQTQVGDYLRAHTRPGDTVQMFGPYNFPEYRAGLLTASRFQTLHAITMRGANGLLQPFQLEWRAEYMQDMRKSKPLFFIVCDAPPAFRQYYGGRLGHEILKYDFMELGRWLDSNYYPETKIGAFTLYHRREIMN